MVSFSPFFRKLNRMLVVKKRFSIAGLVFVLLLLFYFFFMQTKSEMNQNLYYIGEDSRWKDAQLYGKEKNISAFSRDILEAIAKEEKIRFKLIHSRSNELEKKLVDGEFQGILSSMNPSQIKQRTLNFSEPYYALGPVLTVSAGSRIEGWNELAKKIVGVYAPSPTVMSLQKDHSIQIRLYDDIKKAFADLNDDQIDGVIFPVLPSLTYVKTFYHGKLKITTPPLDDQGLHLVALKNERGEGLIQHFNRGLEAIKKNGTYDQLLKRWDLPNTEKIPEEHS